MAGRGNLFDKCKSHEEASVAFTKVIEIKPQHPFTKGLILNQKMLACDWKGIDDLIADIDRDVASGKTIGGTIRLPGNFVLGVDL